MGYLKEAGQRLLESDRGTYL